MRKEMKITFCLAIIISLGNSLINSYFAPIAIEKQCNESIVGMIISIYSFMIIFITPFVSQIINKIGRKRIFIITLGLQAFFLVMYGVISLIDQKEIFISCSFMLRIIHGASAAININLIIGSAGFFSDPEEMNYNYAFIDLGWMLGKFCGPSIASFMYSFGGLFFTYFLTAVILLIPSLWVFGMEFKESTEPIKSNQSFLSSLFKFDVFILTMCQFLNMLSKTFYAPTFANHLIMKFKVSIEYASRIQSVSFISYYFTLTNIDSIINKFGIHLLLVSGLFMNFISVLFLNPIGILPQIMLFVILGFLLLGIPSASIDIPVLVQLNELLEKKYNYNEDLAHDIASSIFAFALFLGEALGPIFGGYLSYIVDFEFSCIVTGIISLSYTVLLIFLFRDQLIEKIIWLKAVYFDTTKTGLLLDRKVSNENPDEKIAQNLKKIGSFNMNPKASFKSFNSKGGKKDYEMGIKAKDNDDYFNYKSNKNKKEKDDFQNYELKYIVSKNHKSKESFNHELNENMLNSNNGKFKISNNTNNIKTETIKFTKACDKKNAEFNCPPIVKNDFHDCPRIKKTSF